MERVVHSRTRMNWKPSGLELAHVVVAIIGAALHLALGGNVWVVPAAIVAGLVFEKLLTSLWTFHETLRRSPYTVSGVNLFVGLAWMGLICACLSASTTLESGSGLPRLVCLMVAFGLVGNVVESGFAAMGTLHYRLENRLLAFPFRKAPVVLGVPLSIRTGYFTTLPVMAWALTGA